MLSFIIPSVRKLHLIMEHQRDSLVKKIVIKVVPAIFHLGVFGGIFGGIFGGKCTLRLLNGVIKT